MNAEAGTEQKMRKGQERDRSGASALDVHLDGYNVKRIGKSRLTRSIGIALAACILVSSPAQAAKTPLISGTESDSDSEADGPALEDGTITENSADNTIASQSGSYTEEQLADSVIEYGELEALVRRGYEVMPVLSFNACQRRLQLSGQPCRLPGSLRCDDFRCPGYEL